MDQLLLDLKAAKEYLSAHELFKGDYVPLGKKVWDGQNCCMNAAVYIVVVPGFAGVSLNNPQERKRVQDALDQLASIVPYRNVSLFNDDPNTTKADAIAAFERAIAARAQKLEDGA
jgi:hypothetical protein